MSELAVETQGLTRRFGKVVAVDDVDLQIPRGSIFGFLGPNGAGKTTTIRLLLGLLEPTTGSARVLGFDSRTQADDIRLRTGALLEHSGIYERLSAEDNLEFYGRVWHLPPAQRQARIKELLTHLDLWDRRKEIAGQWSRGMKQKLAIARALLHHPTLIFLDEPTAGLDPVAAAAFRDDLAELVGSEGVTVFLTTHNLPEAEKLCNLVGVIREGKLLAVDSPDRLRDRVIQPRVTISGQGFNEQVLSTLRARPEVASVDAPNGHITINLSGNVQVAPLITLLVNQGAQIEEVCREKASLEDVFLTLMEVEK